MDYIKMTTNDDIELLKQAQDFVLEIEPKQNHNLPADVITRMFNLHNKIFFRNMEHSRGCGGCRQRVWQRLRTYYYENKGRLEV